MHIIEIIKLYILRVYLVIFRTIFYYNKKNIKKYYEPYRNLKIYQRTSNNCLHYNFLFTDNCM